MTNIIIITSIIIIIVVISFILRLFFKEKYPYEKVTSVVTDTELDFLNILISLVPENYYLLTKVRLADAVNVKKGTKEYLKYFSKIQSKHLDFLICNNLTFEPLLVIELDDPSHLREDAAARDEVKDNVLKAAGLPVLRIKTSNNYNVQKLKGDLLELLS